MSAIIFKIFIYLLDDNLLFHTELRQLTMEKELLKYLKSSIIRDWLTCYSSDLESNQESKDKFFSSRLLYQLTQAKMQRITNFAVTESVKPAVFVVENNPVDFTAAFLAGVITETDIFLCDPNWQQQEWQQVLKLVQPDIVFANQAIKFSILKSAGYSQTKSGSVSNTDINVSGASIMIPTGGTSGKIRFAIHNWSTLTASVSGFARFFSCSNINSFCTLPLYHVSGLMQLMRSLLTQGNLVVCPYKLLASKSIELDTSKYFISLVPTQLQYLLEHVPGWLKEFKTVLVGGAAASPSLLAVAREQKIPVSLIYGMTETASGVVALKPQDFLKGNNSSGKVLPHARISINHERSQNVPQKAEAELSFDRRGSIQIASDSLCLGYYSELSTPVASLVTDDLGYFDAEGYLHLIGRDSQKIITGGENVYPIEVEAAICATKLVQDVLVLGIPDAKWGEAVTAFYVPSNSADDLSLIKQQGKLGLAKYKQPKNWIKVDYIPRNNRGKVNYQQLKAIAIKAINKSSNL